jgi:hypothetical protein
VAPTIFTGNNKMRIFQEEIFGPVASVTSFTDYDDAIGIANDTLYGLGAGVWSRDGNTANWAAAISRPAGCGPTAITPTRPMPRSAATSSPASAAKPQDDARPLPTDEESADVLQRQSTRVLLIRD